MINIMIKINLIHYFPILGDFCGKRDWWFQRNQFPQGKTPTTPICTQRMNMLFFFEYDYCSVDMMKKFSDADNAE